jgi:hypothetical protein
MLTWLSGRLLGGVNTWNTVPVRLTEPEKYRCRAWHDRRVTATKDSIFFSRLDEIEDEEQVIDAILLFEIENIGGTSLSKG